MKKTHVLLTALALGFSVACAAAVQEGKVKTAASGFRFTEGPVWHPDGFIIFSDIPANTIYRLNKNGKKAVYRRPSGKSNGLAFDAEGRLLACEHGNRRVSITRNGEPETLVASYKGQRLNSPNDLVIRSDGSIYFTDPPYGVPSKKRELDFQGVYRIGPDGEQLTLLLKDFERPNGIALSPDEETLYVADTQKNWVRAFDVQEDGSVTNGRVFARAGNLHPDGMAMDVEGNLYVTGGGGVWVFSPDGSRVGIIETERMPANVAFGGPEGRTLYITARSDLYTVPVKYRGASLDYRIEHAD